MTHGLELWSTANLTKWSEPLFFILVWGRNQAWFYFRDTFKNEHWTNLFTCHETSTSCRMAKTLDENEESKRNNVQSSLWVLSSILHLCAIVDLSGDRSRSVNELWFERAHFNPLIVTNEQELCWPNKGFFVFPAWASRTGSNRNWKDCWRSWSWWPRIRDFKTNIKRFRFTSAFSVCVRCTAAYIARWPWSSAFGYGCCPRICMYSTCTSFSCGNLSIVVS